ARWRRATGQRARGRRGGRRRAGRPVHGVHRARVSPGLSRMRPDGWLLAVCLARALMTSIFMTYAAALPVLRPAWGMSATAAGSISTGPQLGYAVSLVVF